MRKILILMGRYLPGHKDGGPLRTMINITDTLGDEYEFYIACLDRDHGDMKSYPDIKIGEWNQVGKAKVWYVAPGGFTNSLILQLAKGMDVIYLTSFYLDFGYKTLLLRKKGRIKCPVALASMGVFSKEALGHKAMKKKLFITGCKRLGLFKQVVWSVTSELEAADVKRVIGDSAQYVVAEDLPRMTIPGRKDKISGPLKVAFLSRICDHKNLDFAIRAIKGAKHNIEFTIYGPIQEEIYWQGCLQQLKHVKFKWSYMGDVPSEKVQERLSEQDVLILPSKSENYGHVVFEALSVGCIPIISDRTPWNSIAESNAGYVLPLNECAFTTALDEIAEMTAAEQNEIKNAAVMLARKKVQQSREQTGYRIIFG